LHKTQCEFLVILGWNTCYILKDNEGLPLFLAKNQDDKVCPKEVNLSLPYLSKCTEGKCRNRE
jgi:hypothetical protein